MPFFDRPPVQNFPDRAFREALEQIKNLRDVLFQAVPELAAHLDFEHARYIKPSFLLEDWRRRESDLLCLIPYRPAGAAESEMVLLCVLLEHQSRPEPLMPLRVLLYAVLFWEQQWKEYERRHEEGASLRLTPVVPIVFHTGAGEWTSNRSLSDLFEGPDALKAYAPQWPLLFWDLAARTPEALLGSDGPFAQFLALVRAEGTDAERFREICSQLVEQLEPIAQQDKMRWRDLLWLIFSWIYQRRPEAERDDLIRVLVDKQHDLVLREEVQTVNDTSKMTWAELYQIQAKAQATVEAKAEAKAELAKEKAELAKEFEQRLAKELERRVEELAKERAKEMVKQREKQLGAQRTLETLRETLMDLLREKFGELPELLATSMRACEDVDRLRLAIRKALTLTSLDNLEL